MKRMTVATAADLFGRIMLHVSLNSFVITEELANDFQLSFYQVDMLTTQLQLQLLDLDENEDVAAGIVLAAAHDYNKNIPALVADVATIKTSRPGDIDHLVLPPKIAGAILSRVDLELRGTHGVGRKFPYSYRIEFFQNSNDQFELIYANGEFRGDITIQNL